MIWLRMTQKSSEYQRRRNALAILLDGQGIDLGGVRVIRVDRSPVRCIQLSVGQIEKNGYRERLSGVAQSAAIHWRLHTVRGVDYLLYRTDLASL